MAMSYNPFLDDWYDHQVAHYQEAVRRRDTVTKNSVELLLLEIGYTEAQLQEFRVLATMRADDMPEDYLPEML